MKPYLLTALFVTLIVAPLAVWATLELQHPRKYLEEAQVKEVILQQDFHGAKVVLNDVYFVHRRNKPNRPIIAYYEIPVEISAFVDLKDMVVSSDDDQNITILLPDPKLDVPNFKWDQAEFESLRVLDLDITLFENRMEAAMKEIKEIEAERKDKITQAALNSGILELTKLQLSEVFEAIFLPLDQEVSIRFAGDEEADEFENSLVTSGEILNDLEKELMSFDTQKDIGMEY
ncbi:hypothetical protein MATR_05660 [Marivirga tractuosa]|uniref:DUF4230 domain-containing protein n=1 Tax=Marivirga tractuosa (strain ATCC 23168 / DSM 4126 / NBRC 15989 / NCIMB 1408 / VKM B-1430 / H-43) TaxID=643867 RepID=E4TS61_MARTH|nr:DUF4230 domain-containing protein [Marivirga tractuosa]ADR21801.1 hypothetical protein Ftrac_1813 [Marivirga tractuosa DSM 4126]BDD13741.1 hypothetical protein MATR_05660 [Marivirga tractuosa]